MTKLSEYSQLQFVGLTETERLFLLRKLDCLLQKSFYHNLIASESNNLILIKPKQTSSIPFRIIASFTLDLEALFRKGGTKIRFKPYKMQPDKIGMDPYLVFKK